MLIRLGGGSEGIKEYLEDGHKQGREMSRNELDERVILAGDLEFTDQLIKDSESDGERYKHITLAFKEDEISRETMDNIVRDFEKFAFAAYGPGEYNFYAEAHLPKIKSYVNQKTGETVERKPHIHIVIPKTNLLSNGSLNPFGLADHNERFLDAFQEHVNNKYGLASPKNNRRIEFTDASDMIQRYKDDEFEGGNKELKGKILSAVLERGVTTYEDFRTLITEFGDVRVRNFGKHNEYQNVKPTGNAKGVNLKEYVFSKEFVELSDSDKREAMSAQVVRKYEVEGIARRDPENITNALGEWHKLRAFEVKYINSGNSKLYKAYKDSTFEEKQDILNDRAARFYEKFKEPKNEPERFRKNAFEHVYGFKQLGRGIDGRDAGPGPARLHERDGRHGSVVDGGDNGPGSPRRPEEQQFGAGRSSGRGSAAGQRGAADLTRRQRAFTASRKYDTIAITRFEATRTLNRVPRVPGLDVVRDVGQREVLLPDHAPDKLEHGRTSSNDALRRDRNRQRGSGRVGGTGRAVDSTLSQHARDLRERGQIAANADGQEFKEIKHKLDASRLLSELSRSHGLLVDKYEVTVAQDGSARIVCGNRKLNVSDFLTREMRLSWSESADILRSAYRDQTSGLSSQGPMQSPSPALWRQFQNERKSRGGQRELWTRQFANERERRDALKRALGLDKRDTRAGLPHSRKAADSVARMTYVAAEQTLSADIRAERQQLRTPVSDQYRTFLHALAETGNADALAELRRMARAGTQRSAHEGGSISAHALHPEANGIFYRGKDMKFRVHMNGDVVYSLGGRAIIEDRGSKLMMLQTDRFAIEAGLRLAEAKFGSIIILSGPKDYQERAALVAAEAGVKVTFENKRLESIRGQHAAELASERARKAENRELGREFVTAQRTSKVAETPSTGLGPTSPAPATPTSSQDRSKKQGQDRER
jgi:hypothetical protein